jgi:hypothetical protein
VSKIKEAKSGKHNHQTSKDAKHRGRKEARAVKPAPVASAAAAAASGGYADGAPFDKVQFLEAKLILKPDRFTSVKSFRDFGKIVAKTAKKVGVGMIPDPRTDLRPEVREIVFVDTSDFRLYNNAYILRRRIAYVDGFPVGDPEIVFKFRHPDEAAATALDMRPKIAGAYEIKFKAEVLPLKDQVGGYRLLYSHNCQFGLSQAHEGDHVSVATLEKIFPQLQGLKLAKTDRISLVNGGIVEEVLLPLGKLDFGSGMVGKCDIGLWRTRGEHTPLVGEFAFQLKFADEAAVAEAQRKLVAQFYVSLQREVAGWLAMGVTKTAMVYRLGGNPPAGHE